MTLPKPFPIIPTSSFQKCISLPLSQKMFHLPKINIVRQSFPNKHYIIYVLLLFRSALVKFKLHISKYHVSAKETSYREN